MTRINITLDESLKKQAEEHAKSLGLSLSSLVRLLLVKTVKKENKLSGIEQGLLDLKEGNYEVYSAEEALSKIKEMINNAKA